MEYHEDLTLSALLKALFIRERIDELSIIEAKTYQKTTGSEARWLQILAGSNLDTPEASAIQAAEEFCYEYLEARCQPQR